jgi:chromosome partitioning protein
VDGRAGSDDGGDFAAPADAQASPFFTGPDARLGPRAHNAGTQLGISPAEVESETGAPTAVNSEQTERPESAPADARERPSLPIPTNAVPEGQLASTSTPIPELADSNPPPDPTADQNGVQDTGGTDGVALDHLIPAAAPVPIPGSSPPPETSSVSIPTPAVQPSPADPVSRPPASSRPPSAVVRPLPRFMAIANQKGGVGKTTTAVNLGAALAELGYRVLVIDLDPQGNATTGLGINARNLSSSIYDVLLNDLSLEDCIEPTAVRNLFLAPATIDLAGAEIELVPAFSRELRLRRALERLGDDYDFTLIDCPPSLGLLTVNGLAAANEVVVPIQCEYYALEGLGQLLRNVRLVQSNLNPTLELGAIILTMYDARTKLSDQVAKDVRLHFGSKVCRNIVPRTIRLSEAPSFGQPIIVFDSTSRGAIAYRELAKEVSGGETRRAG